MELSGTGKPKGGEETGQGQTALPGELLTQGPAERMALEVGAEAGDRSPGPAHPLRTKPGKDDLGRERLLEASREP